MRLRFRPALLLFVASLACRERAGTEAPPDGWANSAPTVVEQVVDRGESRLIEVRQGELRTWVQVPAVAVKAGDFVLLGRGSQRTDVPIPELGLRASEVVDIAHVQVVDEATARATVAGRPPAGALTVAQVYAELDQRVGTEVVVFGRVVKAPSAVGLARVDLQDGSGDPGTGTHDLTVQTQQEVVRGQWLAFRGTLRRNVDLGFGYHYAALVEGGTRVE